MEVEGSGLRVVTAGKVVEAEWLPTDVPGLALAGKPVSNGWRLVHIASGRAVSRSAEHPDPEVVKELAKRVADLADWTSATVAASVPRLREQLDEVLDAWHADHPAKPVRRATPPESPIDDLERLVARVRASERERIVLREVLRKVEEKLPPAAFAEVLASLDDSERDLVRSILPRVAAKPAEDPRPDADTTAVVQAIRTSRTPATRAPAAARSPARPGPPRAPGSDAAAS